MRNEILDFIQTNFNNKRKLLKSKIKHFLLNPEKSERFMSEFNKKINTIFTFRSINSIKKYRKNSEIGDISDIWTFVLNEELQKINIDKNKVEIYLDEYLGRGKELHLCKIWINWFLDVCYIETSFEKSTKNVKENRILKNLSQFENEIYSNILEVLEKQNCIVLELPLLKEIVKGIQTDCVDNPSIFECLFSDLIYPTQNEKITRKKIEGIEVILTEKFNQNLEIIKKEIMFGNGNIYSYRIDFDKNNKIIEVLNNKQISKTLQKYGN